MHVTANVVAAHNLRSFADRQPGAERAPTVHVYAYLACAYVELDRLDDAQNAIKAVLEITPRHTVKEVANRFVYRIDEDRNRVFGALRKAGLPEG